MRFYNSNPFSKDQTAGELDPIEEIDGTVKINTLVLGLDNGHTRSDVIMLVTFDEARKTINLTSIPRDTKVKFNGKTELINAAYGKTVKDEDGNDVTGVALTAQKVKELLNVPINYYVVFTFEGFKSAIDALGGVEFDVPQRMNYDDPYQDLHIHLEKGMQTLDGDHAEQLVRFRHYVMGDLDRVKVQQNLFKAMADQYLNASTIAKIPKLYGSVKSDVLTNYDASKMMKYGKKMLSVDKDTGISTCTLPTYSDGGSHLYPDMDKIKVLRSEVLNYYDDTSTPEE